MTPEARRFAFRRIFSTSVMGRATITKCIAFASPLTLLPAATALLAEDSAPPDEPAQTVVLSDGKMAASAHDIIFSNLDADGSYNTDTFAAKPVAGRQAGAGQTERWDAVLFIPKVDVQVKRLSAAIGYISGTKLVNLALYSNNDILNTVGDPLPGGGGSTRDIPDLGQCCQMATVALAGEGVVLQAGVRYWLVASPDDVRGPTFSGKWHVSNHGSYAQFGPPFPWDPQSGGWPAAELRGTRLRGSSPANVDESSPKTGDTAANRTIFNNLDSIFGDLYTAGVGGPIAGKDAAFVPEIWLALPFTPKADVHAKMLAAAIAYVSGTKKVKLGVYTDNGGLPGTPLPGGQGSTTDFPDSGECCGLATVRLPGAGVALQAGVQFWLVASPDNVNASDFHGIWQITTLALGAYKEPEQFIGWTNFTGSWLAAEIRGTSP